MAVLNLNIHRDIITWVPTVKVYTKHKTKKKEKWNVSIELTEEERKELNIYMKSV